MPNKFNIETWQYTFIQATIHPASPSPLSLFCPDSASPFRVTPQLSQLASRIQPFTCYLPFEQTSLFSSACALINSQSVTVSYPAAALLTGVFISLFLFWSVFVDGIVIIFYAKSNKVNKNIAKEKKWRGKGDRKKVWPCRVLSSLVCYAGNKRMLTIYWFHISTASTHTHTRTRRSSPVNKFYAQKYATI